MKRDRPPHLEGPPAVAAALSPPNGVFVALALAIAADAFVGGLVLLTPLAALVGIPLAIGYLAKAPRGARGRPAFALALAVAAPLIAVAALVGNALHARAVRTEVIAAVERFHAREGRWPRELGEVTPRDLLYVPRARFVVVFGTFDYFLPYPPEGPAEVVPNAAGEAAPPRQGPILYYVVYPPFFRSVYSFDDKAWRSLD